MKDKKAVRVAKRKSRDPSTVKISMDHSGPSFPDVWWFIRAGKKSFGMTPKTTSRAARSNSRLLNDLLFIRSEIKTHHYDLWMINFCLSAEVRGMKGNEWTDELTRKKFLRSPIWNHSMECCNFESRSRAERIYILGFSEIRGGIDNTYGKS